MGIFVCSKVTSATTFESMEPIAEAATKSKTTNEKLNKSCLIPYSNSLTEDEQLEQFAKLIIDIYFDQQYENEKNNNISVAIGNSSNSSTGIYTPLDKGENAQFQRISCNIQY